MYVYMLIYVDMYTHTHTHTFLALPTVRFKQEKNTFRNKHT
jgi:hypothetical protein